MEEDLANCNLFLNFDLKKRTIMSYFYFLKIIAKDSNSSVEVEKYCSFKISVTLTLALSRDISESATANLYWLCKTNTTVKIDSKYGQEQSAHLFDELPHSFELGL
jgi:hypothetical protein